MTGSGEVQKPSDDDLAELRLACMTALRQHALGADAFEDDVRRAAERLDHLADLVVAVGDEGVGAHLEAQVLAPRPSATWRRSARRPSRRAQ